MNFLIYRENRIAVINSEGGGRGFFPKPRHQAERTADLMPGETVVCLSGFRDYSMVWMLVASAHGVGWVASHYEYLGWDYVD